MNFKYSARRCFQLLFISIVLPALYMNAQTKQEPCASAIIHNKLMAKKGEYAAKIKANEQLLQQAISNAGPVDQTQSSTYKIPVVVHVIHLGEPIGTGTNISDAQIYSAISSLNDAFGKAPGSIYDGNGVDTDIEFCLASKDPNGNPTTGINRINGTGTADYENIGIDYDTNEVQVKALSFWDNTKYYNIWVVSEIGDNNGGSGTQGYAYFPIAGPFTEDGAVVLYNAFGFDPNMSLGYNLKPYTNLNITLIHELGHGLDLYHTFEGDDGGTTCPPNTAGQCLTEGDLVCDVPPHIRSASNCVPDANANSCAPGTTAADYQHNYMDYSSDACQNMFTADQAARMVATLTSLRSSLVSASNLADCGCAGSTVNISQTAGTNPTCAGQAVTFTAVPSGGSSPAYQWMLNNSPLSGETNVTLSSTSLSSGSVTCVMTVPGENPDTSNAIDFTSNPAVVPVLYTAQISGTSPACTGDMLSFVATAINGGSDPTYQWQVNGVNAGSDTSEFSSLFQAGTAVVTCILTSNKPCASPVSVTSSPITLTINPGPVVNYVSNQNICGGYVGVTNFSSTPSGATYAWTNSNPSIGLSGSGTGSVPSFTAINSTNSTVTATISVTPILNGTCQGAPSTYTITVNPTPTILQNGSALTTFNTGSSYQWFLDNEPIPGATSSSYTPVEQGDYSVVIGGNPCPSNIITNTTAGIEQQQATSFFNVYPNPSEGLCTILFNTPAKATYKLELKNELGAAVYEESLTDFNGMYSKTIDLSHYGKGVYLISITGDGHETVRKVVVH
ncbi:MAG: M43 family zinc metalloprotease [Bacteroidia bacterium]